MEDGNFKRMAIIFLGAVAFTALTLGIVWVAAPHTSYLFDFFFNRSWIQFASVLLFWITIMILVTKHRDYFRELAAYRSAAKLLEEAQFGSALIWSHAIDIRDAFLQEDTRPYHGSIVYLRIVGALNRLHATQSTKSLEDYFRTRSDQDADEMETGYAGVRYCVWLLPTLGFVGTVMGIGGGIAQFAGIIQNARDFEAVQSQLPAVTGQLGTAFDTTMLALILAAVAVFYMSLLLKQEERVLEQIDRLCSDGICSLFQEHSTASESIIQAIHQNVEEISTRMNGNRGALEGLIRQEMPALVGDGVAAPIRKLEDSLIQTLTVLVEQIKSMNQSSASQRDESTRGFVKIGNAQIRSNKEVSEALTELGSVLHSLKNAFASKEQK